MAHTQNFLNTKTQKHKNTKERLSERIPKFIWGRPSVSSFDDGTSSKMQRSECRTPSWLGGMPSDAAFRWWDIKTQRKCWYFIVSQRVMFLTKKKPLLFSAKNPAILSQNSRLTANFRICERTRTRKSRGHQPYPRNRRAIGPFITHCLHKKSLHPYRRMAWKILRHGVAVNFLSPHKYIEQSLTNKCVPIKFYKISEKLTAIGFSHKLWFNKSIMSSWTRFRISPRAFLVLLRGQMLKQVQHDNMISSSKLGSTLAQPQISAWQYEEPTANS